MKISKGKFLLILGIALVVIDQVIKVLVKTHMTLGESIDVIGDWFKIYFIENEGMAFGMKWGGKVGKFLLSLFRIGLFGGLVYWVSRLVRRDAAARAALGGEGVAAASGGDEAAGDGAAGSIAAEIVPMGAMVGLTMIAAGALGNIFDCYFYGLIFSESTYRDIAVLGGHYAPFMFGRVVDMFYFPIIDTTFPTWLPGIGGHPFRFFAPVFNFADACVSCGAIYLILFQYKFFLRESDPASAAATSGPSRASSGSAAKSSSAASRASSVSAAKSSSAASRASSVSAAKSSSSRSSGSAAKSSSSRSSAAGTSSPAHAASGAHSAARSSKGTGAKKNK